MEKIVSFFIALIIFNVNSLCNAQLVFNIENKEQIDMHTIKIKFVIKNNTNETYIIPIDTTGFNTTFEENTQDDIEENFDLIKGLSLSPLLYTSENNYIEPKIKYKESLGREDKMIRQSKIQKEKRDKEMRKWKENNSILNKEITWISYNKYLFNNLLVISPNSFIEFEKNFSFEKFTVYNDILMKYAYYNIESGAYKIKFKIFPHLIENFLTDTQKKIFMGKYYSKELESNFIHLNYKK